MSKMRVRGKVIGSSKLLKALNKAKSAYPQAAADAVAESTLYLHAESVRLLQANTDGDLVMRYKPKRAVFASKPGTPPNTDRGGAVKSIKFVIDGLVGTVGTNLKYLARFETSTKSNIQRPWLSVALESTAKEIGRIFKRHLKGVRI